MQTMKDRLHVVVAVDDFEGAADRLESLGGRRIEPPIEVGYEVRAVADPEGNEFGPVTDHSEDGG
jgi:predicted enzyme related to lactoylglutathione lyase